MKAIKYSAICLFVIASGLPAEVSAKQSYETFSTKQYKKFKRNSSKLLEEGRAAYKTGNHILGISGDVPRAIAQQMQYKQSIRKGNLPGELTRFGKANPPAVGIKVWESAVRRHFGDYAFIQNKKFYNQKLPSRRAVSLATLEKIEQFMDEIIKKNGNKLPNTRLHKGPNEPTYFNHKTYNMHVINQQLVIPLTYKTRSSLAGFLGGAAPTYFVSHNWSGSFKQFMTAIRSHYKQKGLTEAQKDNVFYWVCTFANNQWSVDLRETDGTDGIFPDKIESSPFAKAINKSKEIISIEDNNATKLTFERSWCFAEMYQTLRKKKPLTVACGNGGILTNDGATRRSSTSAKTCPTEVIKAMRNWTFLKHQASVEEDRNDILETVCGKSYRPKKKCALGSKIEEMVRNLAGRA